MFFFLKKDHWLQSNSSQPGKTIGRITLSNQFGRTWNRFSKRLVWGLLSQRVNIFLHKFYPNTIKKFQIGWNTESTLNVQSTVLPFQWQNSLRLRNSKMSILILKQWRTNLILVGHLLKVMPIKVVWNFVKGSLSIWIKRKILYLTQMDKTFGIFLGESTPFTSGGEGASG